MSSDEESINNDQTEDENNEMIEVGEDVQGEGEPNTEEVQRDEGAAEESRDEERQVAKPKRVVRNPQPKLNSETLKGPRGIGALESYFERVKFKGKGYERQDLNVTLKTYEYWCHRLFPKFPFDTCIERLEKLGNKREVQTHIKRIRFDLLIDEDKPIIDSSDEEANVEGFVENDETNLQNQQFDNLLTTTLPLPQDNQTPAELTEEQLERIKLNKERAAKLRQGRLKKIRDKAEETLEASSQRPSTSGMNNERTVHPNYSQDDTQSDTLSQEVQTTVLDEPHFDLESNIKGKSAVRGTVVKKRSSKAFNGTDSSSSTKGHEVIRSETPSEIEDDDDDDSLVSRKKVARFRNRIESNDSDQEMEDAIDDTYQEKQRTNEKALESDLSDQENNNGLDSSWTVVNGGNIRVQKAM